MESRGRLLVVSNTPFLPASAGNRVRIGRMLDYLAGRGWEIAMLLLADWGMETWDLDGMRRQLVFLEVATPSRSLAARALRAAGRLTRRRADGSPRSVDDWCPAWFARRARRLAREWRPDVVLVEYVWLSRVLGGLPGRPLRVIDTHDVMHRRQAAYRLAGMTPRWFHTSREAERRGLARADFVLAISDEDARVLGAMLPTTRVLLVPHGEPMRLAPPEAAVPGRVLYVASDNDLNVDGLRWFLGEVWPLVCARRPAELVVCGAVCQKLGRVPDGVVLRGFVPELDEEYARARVVLSPLRGGTGMKIKVAEALAHGRPVVATAPGAEGIAVRDDAAVVVADDPRAFADGVLDLLGDEERWRRAVVAAGEAAGRQFAPEVVLEPLAALFEAAVAGR